MIKIKLSAVRFSFKHRFFLSCLAIVWIIGMIIIYLINWRSFSKVEVQTSNQRLTNFKENKHIPPALNYKMAETMNYCNPPNDFKPGQEGKAPVNGSLVFVAMMFRHGDRAPLQPIRNQTTINCGTTDNPLLSKYLKTLKHLRGSAKHLAPFTTFPLHPALKQCTISQMTLLGAHQHLMLGQALKKSYIEDHHLLAKNWTSNDIRVYSTIYSRTFQSAVAFLFGFLPTFNISSIRITPMPDTRFCMSMKYCQCPLSFQLEELYQKKKELLRLSHSAVLKVMEELNPIVKDQPHQDSLQDPFLMFDSLMGYVCHAAPLPCVPGTSTCTTFEHVQNIIEYLKWIELYFLADSTQWKAVILKTQGFFKHVIHSINNYISGKNSVRLVLYSAHDISLHPVLTVLGIHDGSLIPYASHIAFEVYKHTVDNVVKYAIKVIYKGNDVTKDMPFCKPYLKSSDKLLNTSMPCPLESFVKFIDGLTSSIGFSSYQAACESLHITYH